MVRLSKRLSRHLRHDPGAVGLELDEAGWADVGAVLEALGMSREQLTEVVARNNKQRFSFDGTGTRIRANQGHSVAVELGLPTAEPPEFLYHGTVAAALPAIRAEGLRPMRRHAVHLSPDEETARRVGARRGAPVILRVAAGRMAEAGHSFQLSANGVWLTDAVPPEYLD
ncbi:RNA 2'-phosphotransferase [Amycolatopsis albispora]|uniref:Probable RNA 2'-phosphotransferase n=1 Tax=Amycolatopsis albispora TaxID=1804986 RepID=A0A344LKK2_9PSEU|nr:RNA 2'-phosphotransferase [Amycolatopsis albispora]